MNQPSEKLGPGFMNARDIVSPGNLAHRFYLIKRSLRRVSFSNNIIECISNRARCILIENFLELSKICGRKFPRKIISLVKRS